MIEFKYHYFGNSSGRTGSGKGKTSVLKQLGECSLGNSIFTWCQRMNPQITYNYKGENYILTWSGFVITVLTK